MAAAHSTLDLVSPGLTMITGPEGRPDGEWPVGRGGPPVSVRRVDSMAAWGLGLHGGAALLVRPDATLAAWLAPEAPVHPSAGLPASRLGSPTLV